MLYWYLTYILPLSFQVVWNIKCCTGTWPIFYPCLSRLYEILSVVLVPDLYFTPVFPGCMKYYVLYWYLTYILPPSFQVVWNIMCCTGTWPIFYPRLSRLYEILCVVLVPDLYFTPVFPGCMKYYVLYWYLTYILPLSFQVVWNIMCCTGTWPIFYPCLSRLYEILCVVLVPDLYFTPVFPGCMKYYVLYWSSLDWEVTLSETPANGSHIKWSMSKDKVNTCHTHQPMPL